MTSTPTIGVYAGVVGGYYFGVVIRGIVAAAKAAGGRVVAIQTLEAGFPCERPDTPRFDQPVAFERVDAWITIMGSASDDQLARIVASGKPLILISDSWTGSPVPKVVPDNAGGVRTAVSHLISHGHDRIAFVGHTFVPDIKERYDAYCATLREHGIEPDPQLFFESHDNLETGGHAAGTRFVAAGLPATAVMCGTDGNALGLLKVLRAADIAVPGRVAVVGFDNDELAARESLSSVSQRFDVIGETAAGLALAGIAGTPAAPGPHTVTTWFVPRSTCGCAAVEAMPPTGEHPALDPVDTLAARLRDVLSLPIGDTEAARRMRASAAGLLDAVTSVLDGKPTDSLQFEAMCTDVHSLMSRDEDVAAVTTIVTELARELAAARCDTGSAVAVAVEDLLQKFGLTCMRLQVNRQRNAPEFFQDLLATQYEISLDLLRRQENRPEELAWLARTPLKAGCFGMWADRGESSVHSVSGMPVPGSSLLLAGAFPADDWCTDGIGSTAAMTQFPPQRLLEVADADPEDAVIVLAVKVHNSDWGWLAVVGPVETRLSLGRQATDQWAALLTVALDSATMLGSLQEQREHLAQAYGRERSLVEGLRASEERYALALRATNDGLWDWDLTSNEIFYSNRWAQMVGLSPDHITTSPSEWLDRVHPDDRSSLAESLLASGDASDALEHEHRLRMRDGNYAWVLCRWLRVTDGVTGGVRLVGSCTDVTERKQLEARLRRDATYDSVTLLPNRVLFLESLALAVKQAKDTPARPFAVLYLDLDGFKVVNDSLGHLFGDRLLIAVSARLQSSLREGDLAARIGGDEFAVLLHDVDDISAVETTADRLQAQLTAPFDIDGHQVVVSAGIGVAMSSGGYDDPEDVLRDADIAMYRAKAQGGGTFVTFSSDMHVRAVQRLSIENELRAAIDSGDFVLHYQPIFTLCERTIEGLEALIRWPHPQRGLLMPSDFLAIADETGLAVGIGEWVLGEGAAQMSRWMAQSPDTPPARVSLNISNRQFWHRGFLGSVENILQTTDVSPDALRLEITESVIMHNPGQAAALLGELHKLGVHLHLDDFGTGYSSLEALHRFEIDALKIDRSFVSRLETDTRSAKIIRTILLMGQDLEVDVIAEGVETEKQAQMLADLGCRLAQGFLFSRPVPAQDAARMLRRGVSV